MSVVVSLNNNISLDFIDKLITVKTPRHSEETFNKNDISLCLSEEMLSDTNQMPYGNQPS